MAEENTNITNKTSEEIEEENKETRSQQRIRQLSDKVELTSKERDELKGFVGERDKKIAELEKENNFNSGFTDMLGQYPLAKDHKDEIKTKVMSGYTVEDATLAVLGKAKKLGEKSPEPTAQEVAGGSAANSSPGTKEVKDMSQTERRAILEKELIWQ